MVGRQMILGVAISWTLLQIASLVQENAMGQNLANLLHMFLRRPFWSGCVVAQSVR